MNWKISHLFFYISSKYTWPIVVLNILVFIISIWGIKNLNVENSFINYFKKDSEIYQGMKLIDQELGGTTPLDIVVKFKNNLSEDQILTQSTSEDDIDIDLEFSDDLFSDSSFISKEIFFY